MRPESGTDSAWLSELCDQWGIRLRTGSALEPPRDEASARALRYAFLEGLVRDGLADRVLTAHHADDQVETVLFRILRGTGVEGLAGIPEEREPGIVRPLLGCSRAELEAYALDRGLHPREDPTNLSPRFARNRLRRTVLPLLEEVHPGARSGILRLAENAAEAAAALELLLGPRLEAIRKEVEPGVLSLDRERFLEAPEVLGRALLRASARSLGVALSRSGTATAIQFMRDCASGASLTVDGSLEISRDFGTFRVARRESELPHEGGAPPSPRHADRGEEEVVIHSRDPGEGRLDLAGDSLRVAWGAGTEGPDSSTWERAEFDPSALRFPLVLRGWRDGDRTRTRGGGKKLKKLFGEMRLPRRARSRVAVLADAGGEVIWIPGLHRAPGTDSAPEREGERFVIGVRDAGEP
jgi:tRNA(Ile)-lysidine synthase